MRTNTIIVTAGPAVLLTLLVGLSGCGSSSPSTTPSPARTTAVPTGPSTPGSTTTSPPPAHATEFSPPGDIPDTTAYLDQTVPGTTLHVKVPEGWAKATTQGTITWTDKYNGVSIQVRPRATAPTVASARSEDVGALRSSVAKFSAGPITMVVRRGGTAVHIVYQLDSAPNPVTGKVVRDVAERFEFWHAGQEAILTLTGPVNADNVDPWRIVSDSLGWR